MVKGQEGIQARSAISNAIKSTISHPHSTSLGESPPPPPRDFFGRDELIEDLVGLAENLTPIALIGAGGIGKTAIALTVLHHDRIRERFGDNRRFVRCDKFPASRTHFLSRLSHVIGAGVANPEDLTLLRPFLSSREIIIVLDNAESILDPEGTGAQEIYPIVEELSHFKTVCLCVTSRITTVPRHCKRPAIPTLSMESACDIFYSICDNGGQSNIVNNLLRRLDFHALSITLLATAASHNMWSYDRLAQEWGTHRVQVLRTNYNGSLIATIELSLASPTFRELGADARDLLGVVAFFPQGINENNLDWLFPTISNRRTIFDKFCVLSLTHRSDEFITMLAPLRDYLCPKDPASSSLLHTTKDHYFSRLSVYISHGKPGFEEARWIVLEDVNVEHLLDVFTTVDANSDSVWDTCNHFMEHLYFHKPRLVVLGPKLEGLPDGHRSKSRCLFNLSRLFESVGNGAERKRLLVQALKLWREQGNDRWVAHTLSFLADANRLLGCYVEGIQQAEEASEIYKQLDDGPGQTAALQTLACIFVNDEQLEAAEEAASQAINLQDGSDQFEICQCYRVLGLVYASRGKTEKAIDQFEIALGIASSFNWHDQQFWNHLNLAQVFSEEKRFDRAHAQIERAKSHAAKDSYYLGRATNVYAQILFEERRFEEAKSEILCAADLHGKLGAIKDVEECREILRLIEEKTKTSVASGESDSGGSRTSRERCYFLHRLTLHSQFRIPDTIPRIFSNVSFREATTLHPVLECSVLRYCSGYYLLSPSCSQGHPVVVIDSLWPRIIPCSVVPLLATNMYMYSVFPTSPVYLLRFFNVARLQIC